MSDPEALRQATLRAFGQRDYELCAKLAYQGFPQVTVTVMHVLLISLQRLGRDDLIRRFETENLPKLARYPAEQATIMMTIGLKEPSEARASVRDDEQLAAFHCCLGSRYLTQGQVELAREQFQLCERVPGTLVEKTLARWQATWPSQEPGVLVRSNEKLAAAMAELNRLRAAGQTPEALSAAAAAFDAYRGDLTISLRHHLSIINNYAVCQCEAGNLDDAAALCDVALKIRDSAVVAECFETSVTQTVIAMIHRRRGDNDAALEYFERALGERKRALGEDAPGSISALANIAIFLMELNRYEAASRYFSEAAAAFDRNPDADASLASDLDAVALRLIDHHPAIREDAAFQRYADRRGSQAKALMQNASVRGSVSPDELRDAIAAAKVALQGYEKPGPGTLPANEMHELLARAHRTAGDYAAALPHLRALADGFKTEAPSGTAQGNVLFQLGTTLMELNQFDEAQKTFERAMEIVRGSAEPVSEDYIKLMNGAAVSMIRVDAAKAETLFLEASDLVARHLAGRADLRLLLDQNRAASLLGQRKFSAVRKLLSELDAAIRRSFGATSFEYFMSLVMRGEACVAEGAFQEAEAQLNVVVDNPIPASREYTRLRYRALVALAHVRAVLGRYAGALAALLETHEFKSAEFEQVSLVATDVERRRYFQQLYHELSIMLTLLERIGTVSEDLAMEVWQFIVRCKAVGPEILMLRRSRAVFGDADSASRDEIGALRQRAAALEMTGCPIDDDAANAYLTNLYKLRLQIGEREVALSNSDLFRRKVVSTIFVDAKRLAVAIPDDSVFVEFFKFSRIPFATLFHPEDETEVHAYLAFVVAGKSKAVTAIAFGDAGPIDAAVQEIRQSVHGERGRIEFGMAARDSLPPEPFPSSDDPHVSLHRAIVRPLLSALAKDVRRLVIAPDGELCRLPFGALMNPNGEHLIDKFVISYLSSGRALMEPVAAPATASPPMVFGNPDYEWDGHPTGPSEHAAPPSDTAGDDLRFQPLPATMAEVQTVSRLLSAQPLIGRSALKSTAVSARSPAVLHFATHGYFLKSEAPEGIGAAMGLPVEAVIGIAAEHAVGGRLSLRIQNPLLRSGIAMAGANAWLNYKTTSAEVGDGLLSAEDIAGMDLSGTQLVVLSACDAGLGDIRLGEGVLGLQRSFAIAGSRTLVMSLWKVPDVVTCLLMERFYANVLQRDQNIDEALREAQMFVRTITVRDVMDRYGTTSGAGSQPAGGLEWLSGQDDGSCPFGNEAYWGGFVCMGSVGSFSSRASPAIPRSAQTSQT